MKKFKNFIPLDYEEREKIKGQIRLRKSMRLLILINLLLFPLAISNIKTQVFKNEESSINMKQKDELIPLDKIQVLMNKSKEFNSEIKISNNNFTIKTLNSENSNVIFQQLYKNTGIKIESVNYGDNFDEIKGVLNE